MGLPSSRYTFNGKELDREWDRMDFEARPYNRKTGRFEGEDPLFKDFPFNTPYAYAQNMVINGIDLEGGEWVLRIFSPDVSTGFLQAYIKGDIFEQRRIANWSVNNNFPDGYAASKIFDDNFANNNVGSLIYDKDAPDGLTVYLYRGKYVENKLASINQDPDPIHFERDKLMSDKNWPVDVRSSDAWIQRYGKYYKDENGDDVDFVGFNFSADATGLGTKSSTIIAGRVKGFGAVSIYAKAEQSNGVDLSISILGATFGNYDKSKYTNSSSATSGLSGTFRMKDGNLLGNNWKIRFESGISISAKDFVPFSKLIEGLGEVLNPT